MWTLFMLFMWLYLIFCVGCKMADSDTRGRRVRGSKEPYKRLR